MKNEYWDYIMLIVSLPWLLFIVGMIALALIFPWIYLLNLDMISSFIFLKAYKIFFLKSLLCSLSLLFLGAIVQAILYGKDSPR